MARKAIVAKTPLYQNAGETGVYLADLIPTRTGTYTVHVKGHLDDNTPVDITAALQDVEASTLAFPDTPQSQRDLTDHVTALQTSQKDASASNTAQDAQIAALQTDRDNLTLLTWTALGIGGLGLVLGIIGLIVGSTAASRARRQLQARGNPVNQGRVVPPQRVQPQDPRQQTRPKN